MTRTSSTRCQGHRVGVETGVALLLPAVGVELLAEVALLVEEAHAHQRDAEAAGRLEVVAGQDPEAAGVLGQRLGDAELGREVGHRPQRRVPGLEPAGPLDVALLLAVDLVHEREEPRVLDHGLEPVPPDRPQQADGIVVGHLPALRVQPAEQIPGVVVPGPPQVEGDVVQRGERLGEPGPDGEALQCPHGRDATQPDIGLAHDQANRRRRGLRRPDRRRLRQRRAGRGTGPGDAGRDGASRGHGPDPGGHVQPPRPHRRGDGDREDEDPPAPGRAAVGPRRPGLRRRREGRPGRAEPARGSGREGGRPGGRARAGVDPGGRSGELPVPRRPRARACRCGPPSRPSGPSSWPRSSTPTTPSRRRCPSSSATPTRRGCRCSIWSTWPTSCASSPATTGRPS